MAGRKDALVASLARRRPRARSPPHELLDRPWLAELERQLRERLGTKRALVTGSYAALLGAPIER